MKTRSLFLTIVGVLLVAGTVCFSAQLGANRPKSLATMKPLRAPQLMQQIGKQATVTGVYYDGSIPMIVDSLDRVMTDEIMSPDSYVPIVGPLPTGLKTGDHISVTGIVQRPSAADPKAVHKESIILKITAPTMIRINKPAAFMHMTKSAIGKFTIKNPGRFLLPNRYAVLIAGGYDAANNHIRYWNDLKCMYGILTSAGYAPGNIYVLYADGMGKDGGMPVNYAATKANINAVFATLGSKMKATDSLYIMLNDHGSPGALCLWNHELMGAGEFASAVAKATNYSEMVIQMKQCYSGGFVGPLTAPKRVVMSSCTPDQVSWSHSTLQYGEFTYWYMAAFLGHKVDSNEVVNADKNNNGKVSILEAYEYARSHDAANELPTYEDNGAAPGHTGQMPAGGEGALGGNSVIGQF